ncbi:MAG: Fic family protein [Firmicutes bacterium]|nr:Fic family protein [Bacillota bacterium]
MYNIYKEIQEKQKIVDFSNKDMIAEILKWLRTELTYTSNYIEGNTLTREETALTIEEGITSGSKPVKDYIEAKNHAEAFDYIVSLINEEKLSYEDAILKIHSIILNGINDDNKGCYRNIRVRISGSDAVLPNPVKVPYLMEEFSRKLNNKQEGILKALEAHYKLVEIHPFVDGNGRTARLLMNLILLRSNTLPLIVAPIERKRYISGINRRNTKGELLHYHKYMLGLLNKSMNLYIKMFGKAEETSSPLMTISGFAKYCGVPVTTIRYYLRIKKLEPYSYTNAGYMLFSVEQSETLIAFLINK